MVSGTESMSIDEIKAQYRANLERAVQGETIIDLWIDKEDYLLRQLQIVNRSIRLAGESGEEEWITSTTSMKWSGHNEPIEIVAPEVEWVPPEVEPTLPLNSGTTPI